MFKTLIALYKPVSSIGDVDYAEVRLSCIRFTSLKIK